MGWRTDIEASILAALAPLGELGLYVVDSPNDDQGGLFDRGTVSVGWIAEQAPPPASTKVFGSPVIQSHTPQFEVHIQLQDTEHRTAAEVVDRVEELVTGLIPTGQKTALYFVRAGFLRLDEDSIWHYAAIFALQVPRQHTTKEAA